jgi:hypothetical protein
VRPDGEGGGGAEADMAGTGVPKSVLGGGIGWLERMGGSRGVWRLEEGKAGYHAVL